VTGKGDGREKGTGTFIFRLFFLPEGLGSTTLSLCLVLPEPLLATNVTTS
jgi:hypothetical protein